MPNGCTTMEKNNTTRPLYNATPRKMCLPFGASVEYLSRWFRLILAKYEKGLE